MLYDWIHVRTQSEADDIIRAGDGQSTANYKSFRHYVLRAKWRIPAKAMWKWHALLAQERADARRLRQRANDLPDDDDESQSSEGLSEPPAPPDLFSEIMRVRSYRNTLRVIRVSNSQRRRACSNKALQIPR